ncbi:MAG: DUF2141 domain-containing protein [Hyphomicrobiales bacterium]|nr:DUF2141 domain-containing protein [Hyphomicrobiales bacterium]
MMYNRSLILAGLILLAVPVNTFAANLSVNIKGIKSTEGNIVIGVLDGARGFPSKRKPYTGQIVKSEVPDLKVIFNDLKPGKYAIVAFHDIDTSGKINRNFIGFPTEAYGFSNDARGKLAPPEFEEAAIELGQENLEITFTISK